jgi:hypothetical protein
VYRRLVRVYQRLVHAYESLPRPYQPLVRAYQPLSPAYELPVPVYRPPVRRDGWPVHGDGRLVPADELARTRAEFRVGITWDILRRNFFRSEDRVSMLDRKLTYEDYLLFPDDGNRRPTTRDLVTSPFFPGLEIPLFEIFL